MARKVDDDQIEIIEWFNVILLDAGSIEITNVLSKGKGGT
jgi:hypothetical protein